MVTVCNHGSLSAETITPTPHTYGTCNWSESVDMKENVTVTLCNYGSPNFSPSYIFHISRDLESLDTIKNTSSVP